MLFTTLLKNRNFAAFKQTYTYILILLFLIKEQVFTMRKQMLLVLFLGIAITGFCQPVKVNRQETSDPKAKAILDKIRKQYDTYKSLEAAFTLTIELPEQKKEIQKGKITQQGEKYLLELNKQTIICDGSTLWYHLKESNEVQINNADAGDQNNILSPKDLLKMYQQNDYLYGLSGEGTENGKAAQFIEFKPLKKNNEYTKLRLAVDKKSGQIVSIRAFSRDGSRYTMMLDAVTPNKKYPDTLFVFNKAKYPGIHVEDLRIE